MTEDQNLLFGVLAVQLKFITPQVLMEAAAGWAVQKKGSLKDYLVENGLISARVAETIAALQEAKVQAHGGDVRATLISFGGDRAIKESFAASSLLILGNKLESFGGDTSPSPVVTPRATTPGGEEGPLSGEELLEDAKHLTLEHPGRYSVQSEHGRGGIGRVMVAFDAHIGREIAVKELIPERATASFSPDRSDRRSQIIMKRFLREARITGQLEHPAIVPVYEVGRRADGSVYYTMKFVRGKTLAKALEESKNLNDRLKLLTHFLNLCHAIAYAHHRNVIHRDIKPGNVMVGEFGETVVIDWGLAKVRGRRDERFESIEKEIKLVWDGKGDETIKGSPIGTPAYMSPEQAEGKLELVDERSDIWSLGAMLFEILTGRIPFDGISAYDIMGKVVKEEPPSILELEPAAPPELAAVARKCLNKDPSQRYQSAEALAQDIENFMTGRLVSVYQYPFSVLFKRWFRKWWPVVATTAVGLVILFAVFIWSYVKIREERNHALLNIAQAYVAHGQWAEAERRWGLAELYYAKALLMADQLSTRYALNFAHTVPAVPLRVKFSLAGGEGEVNDLVINREGTLLAAAGEDKIVRLWDLGTGQPIAEMSGPEAPVLSLAFAPDGKILASASQDGTVRLFDLYSRTLKHTLAGSAQNMKYLAFDLSGQFLAGAGDSPLVQLWDTNSGAELWKVKAHEKDLRGLAFSPDGHRLATWSKDQTLRVWEIPSGKLLGRMVGHTAVVLDATFFPDGNRLLSASWDRTVKVWDLAAGETVKPCLATFVGPAPARFVRLSPNTLNAIVGYDSGAVQLLELSSADHTITALQTWKAHPGSLTSLAVFPDFENFASAGGDQMVRLFNLHDDNPANAVRAQMGEVSRIAIAPSGNLLAFAGRSKTLRLYEVESKGNVKRYQTFAGRIWDIKADPQGKFVVISGQQGETVKLLDLQNEEIKDLPVDHADGVRGLAISPDGRYLVTASWDKTVGVWDLKQNQPLYHKLTGPNDKVWCVVVIPGAKPDDPAGALIVAGGNDPALWVWSLLTGTPLYPAGLIGHTDKVRALAVSPRSPQEKLIASAGLDKTIRLWRLDTLAPPVPTVLSGHTNTVTAIAFSPDGQLLASASQDKTVRLWEVQSGKLLHTLLGHQEALRSVQFSRDGLLVISASEDSEVKLWEVKTGKLIRSLVGPSDSLRSVAVRPDFGLLAVGAADHLLRLWNPGTGELMHVLSGHQGTVEQVLFVGASFIVSGDDTGQLMLWPFRDEFFKKPPHELYSQAEKETGFTVRDMELVPIKEK